MKRKTRLIVFATLLAALTGATELCAGRGFGGGRGGGGGGSRGGERFSAPSFHPAPSMGGGGFRPEGNFGGNRPAGGFNERPQFNNRNENFNRNNENFNGNRVNNNFNNNVNVGNRAVVNNRSVNVNNNRITNVNNFGGSNVYAGYHSNWVHGYWNPHYGGFGGYGGYGGYGLGGYGGYGGYGLGGNGFGWGLGAGLATAGLAAWALSPMMYNMGYSSYSNPYYGMQGGGGGGGFGGGGGGGGGGYNYAQPINPQAAPPAQSVTDVALANFDAARAAFQAGDYAQALQQTDQALTQLPNDPALHQFRALVLFALGRYDQAAVPLYAVLSAGPGWDWTTLASLYADVGTYTNQLRALEAYCRDHPQSAQAHFVLAYHYMTEGFADNAVAQLKLANQLQPDDPLTARLIQQLTPPPAGAAGGATATATATAAVNPADVPPAPPQRPEAPAPPPGATVVGSWTANPNKDTSIALTIKDDGGFVWKVTEKGQTREFGGTASFGNGILTLAQQGQPGQAPEQAGAMVGKVTWSGPQKFTFQALGGGPGDPGLTFSH